MRGWWQWHLSIVNLPLLVWWWQHWWCGQWHLATHANNRAAWWDSMWHPAGTLQDVVAWGELTGGKGDTTRGNATTIQRVDKRWRHNERQRKAEGAQQEVTQQPAGTSMRGGGATRGNVRREAAQQEMTQQPAWKYKGQMGGSRWRLRIKRQLCNENSAMRGDDIISQGKLKGGRKASVMLSQPQQWQQQRWWCNKGLKSQCNNNASRTRDTTPMQYGEAKPLQGQWQQR